jgi:hypothetical protein
MVIEVQFELRDNDIFSGGTTNETDHVECKRIESMPGKRLFGFLQGTGAGHDLPAGDKDAARADRGGPGGI